MVKTHYIKVQIGMLFLFIQHTSAALTINEDADPGESQLSQKFIASY